jgi:two-component system copper resistance phosphate regulon response regulator CusR
VKVLLVEDEERIASFVVKGLAGSGYDVEHVETGAAAICRASAADVVVLDLGLPDMDGLEALRRMREDGVDTQVIVLTARGRLRDRVEGLEEGADDYLAKPFAFAELLARIRARLRAREGARSSLRVEGIEMNVLKRRVVVDGRRVELSGREFQLLEAFLRAPNQVLSRPQLLARVWELEFDPRSNIVEVYVRSLRRKVGRDRIQTVRGGYRLLDDDLQRT